MALGVKETKDIVVAVAKWASAGGKVVEDGKVSLADIAYCYEPLTAMGEAVEGASQVPAEVLDLDAAELSELHAVLVKEFDVPQDGVEAVVEKALVVAKGLAELVLSFRKKPTE